MFKSNTNEKVKGRKKSEEQKRAMKNINALYKWRKKVMKFVNDFSKIFFEAKHKTKHGEGLKVLIPKQMLKRLPIALS